MKRLVLFLLAVALACPAHELVDNRATLVLRDRNHLSLAVYLSYPEALHQALLPQREFAAFLLIYSSMDSGKFEKELARAQKSFQAQLRVFLPEKEVVLSGWSWPDAKTVQEILRQRVMRAMVDPNVHAHEPQIEVRAEAVAAQEIAGARVQFPAEWQRVLLVWYRPSQQWVEGRSMSPVLRFPGGGS
jgi:hypothetical protein